MKKIKKDKTKFILTSFNSTEKKGRKIHIKIADFSIGDFNLLISDNAQGKTRLFNTLNFFSNLFIGRSKIISTTLKAKFEFQAINKKTTEKIIYEMEIEPKNGKNIFYEEVVRNNKQIYSSKDKILFNESTGSKVKDFFIPKNLPALTSIDDPEFITLTLIRGFFQRFVHISAEKTKTIVIDPESLIPNKSGTNIASVLNNWYKLYPEIFNETINELKECFYFIDKVFFIEEQIPSGPIAQLLAIKEKKIDDPILQIEWSDGIYRMSHLLMSTKIPFVTDKKLESPSIILIDEIENGLDFKSLKYIVRYLQEYSDDSQIVISSHSPLVCDFVDPSNWIIPKRNGCKINYLSPRLLEKNLMKNLELFKHKHWMFYKNHISHSSLYRVK